MEVGQQSADVIDGKAFATNLRERIGHTVEALRQQTGKVPGLAVVLVGEDPASQVYVRSKGKATREAGITSIEHRLPEGTSETHLLRLLDDLNKNPEISGILVQLPLPPQIDTSRVLAMIDPAKDVDGFHVSNVGKLATGQTALVPCTPLGCLMLLKQRLGDLSGREAVIVGRSNIVGKPMAQLLLTHNATVTVAHSRSSDVAAVCRRADILIAAVGKPRIIGADAIKQGATVIDVGINRIEEDGRTRLVGDVDFSKALRVAGAITPVPGGVGPMTIACLLLNTVFAFCDQQGLVRPAEFVV